MERLREWSCSDFVQKRRMKQNGDKSGKLIESGFVKHQSYSENFS